MTECAYCKAREGDHLYEDELCFAKLVRRPATTGHIVLLPKEHFAIIEQVPDEVMHHLFVVANKLGAAAFDGLKAQGSNLLIQNGIAAGQTHNHVMLHLLPRFQQDGVDFTWQPQQVEEAQLDAVIVSLSDALAEKKSLSSSVSEVSSDEQYLLDQLHRLP
ncbi:HIT domain-containing protein [Candidatus Woesearchaeota archaeon]|nr:HIT domain-containing protein [Candidatus Woesearchaeota archaeon]